MQDIKQAVNDEKKLEQQNEMHQNEQQQNYEEQQLVVYNPPLVQQMQKQQNQQHNDHAEVLEQHIENVQENLPQEIQGNLIVLNGNVVVQPADPEVLALNLRVEGLLNAGKTVARYHKSLKGWGSLTHEQEAELEQSKTTLTAIKDILAQQELNVDSKTKEELILLQGRYEAHLLVNNFRYRSDSDEMTAVKDSIMELEGLLAENTAINIPADMINKDNLDQNMDVVRGKINVYQPIVAAYQKAINACKNYTDNRDSQRTKGLERRTLVAESMKRMTQELEDLVLGMQLMRRGKILNADNPKDLLAQAAVYRKSDQEIPKEWTEKHKGNQFRNYSPDKYMSDPPTYDVYKRMGKETEAIFKYMESDAKIIDLFKPDKNGRLDKDGLKLKADFLELYRELRAFPKDKYYSRTLVIGKTSFTVFQSENNELLIHYGQLVHKMQSSAQVLADDIALRFAANEKVFGSDSVRELSEWMRDENLDLSDMQTMVRIDSQCKEIISTRLKMRKSDLANISIEKIKEIALGLVDENITADQAKKMIDDVENRVLEKQQLGVIKDKNEEIEITKSLILQSDEQLKDVEKRTNAEIKKLNDKVDERIMLPKNAYSAELKELRKGLEAAKLYRQMLKSYNEENLKDPKVKAQYDKLLTSIENEFGITYKTFQQEGVVVNQSKDIPQAPDFVEFTIGGRLDELIQKNEKKASQLNTDMKKREVIYEFKQDIDQKRAKLNQTKKLSKKGEVAELKYELKEAEDAYKAAKSVFAQKLSDEIDSLEDEIDALNLSHKSVAGDTDETRHEAHAKIRRQVREKKEVLTKKQDELEAFLHEGKHSDAGLNELKAKYDELKIKYDTAKQTEEALGIEAIEKDIKETKKLMDENLEELRMSFYTVEEAEKLNDILKKSDEDKKVINEVKTKYEEKYEKLGGEEKGEELKNEIDRMKLAQKDSLTDELVNDELTRQKINLYNHKLEDRQKYDKMITFEEAKEEKDEDAIELVQEKNTVSWSADEQEFLDLLADLIYNKDTWTMDEKRNDPAALFASVLASHSKLVLRILVDPSLLDGFFEKLPLDMGGTEEERTNMMYDEALPEHEKLPTYKDKIKKSFTDILNKYVAENEEIGEKVNALRDIKKQIEDAKKEVEDAAFRVKLFEEEKRGGAKVLSPEEQKKFDEKHNSGFWSFFKKTPDQEAQEKLEKAEDNLESLENSLQRNIGASSLLMGPLIRGYSKKMAGAVNDFNKTLDEYMNDETLTKNIEECVNNLFNFGETQKTDTSKIPDPKDKHLSKEEREKAIKQGNEALLDIIRESMSGNEGQGQFIKNIMKNYVTGVTKLDVKSMMASAIRNLKPVDPALDNKLLSDEARLGTYASFLGGVLKGAGPLMQKMMQGIPDQLVPEAFKSSIKDMKSNLAPIPKEVVKAELASMIARSNGKILGIKVEKSLGAASVGQAFLCTIDYAGGNDQVVVKILRPDVRNKMQREKAVMLKSAKEAGEGMYHSYKGMLDVYEDELDLTLEAKNCEKGSIYNIGGGVKSMKLLNTVAPSTNSMVCERAKGVTVDAMLETMKNEYEAAFGKYFERDEEGKIVYDGDFPKLKIDSKTPGLIRIQRRFSAQLKKMQDAQERMIRLAGKWVQEGVFGDGFYHGDLHAGNIVMGNFELTVIDYGNATQLTKDQQAEITRMMVAAAAGDVEGFRNGFKKLLENTSDEDYKKKEPELTAALTEVFRLGDKRSAGQRIAAALMKAQQIGFEIPTSVYNFSQCELRLQNTIDDMNEQIKKYQKALGQIEDLGKLESFDVISKLNEIPDQGNRSMMISMLVAQSDDNIREVLREKDPAKITKIDNYLFGAFANFNDYSNPNQIRQLLTQNVRNPERLEYNLFTNLAYFVSDEDQKLIKDQLKLVTDADAQARQQVIETASVIISEIAKKYNYKPLLDEYRAKLAQNVDPNNKDKEQLENEKKELEKERKELEDKLLDKIKPLLNNEAKRLNDIVGSTFYLQYKNAKEDYEENIEEQTDQNVIKAYKKQYDERKAEIDTEKATLQSICTVDNMVGGLRTSLSSTDEGMIKLAEKELSGYFADEENQGKKLKELYDDFRKAQSEGKQNANELLEKFLNKFILVAGMKRLLNDDLAENPVVEYSKDEPKDFLDVMGDVVNDNWMTALGRLGTKVSKYRKALED